MSEKTDKTAPVVHSATTAAKTRIFHIQELDIEFSNGNRVRYERLKSGEGGAVLILPMVDAETVLLIREYAAGVNRYELALPKGKVEPGEDLLEAANREIKEEVGYGAKALKHIHSLTIAPGYISHTTHIILAEDLYPESAEGDEPEAIEVIPWKLNRLHELVQHPECTEARSIAALYIVRDLLLRRN
ncbi:MAG: ADP compounds hydrolase NudE [Gammaproteobacteria bacterium]|nr:ADP compounds hydrolase NudE [Gammaproteobacteria bacterium]